MKKDLAKILIVAGYHPETVEALTAAVEDTLTRWHQMKGHATLYVPDAGRWRRACARHGVAFEMHHVSVKKCVGRCLWEGWIDDVVRALRNIRHSLEGVRMGARKLTRCNFGSVTSV